MIPAIQFIIKREAGDRAFLSGITPDASNVVYVTFSVLTTLLSRDQIDTLKLISISAKVAESVPENATPNV